MSVCCEASRRWSLCTPLYLYPVGVSRGSVHSKYAYYKILLSEEQRKLISDGHHRVLLRCVCVCVFGWVDVWVWVLCEHISIVSFISTDWARLMPSLVASALIIILMKLELRSIELEYPSK